MYVLGETKFEEMYDISEFNQKKNAVHLYFKT